MNLQYRRAILNTFKIFRFFLKGTRIQHTRLATFVYLKLIQTIVPSGSDVEVSFRGCDFIVQNMDVTLLPSIMDESYEEYELDWITSFFPKDKSYLFIDIGANVGLYTILVASQTKFHCVAIEPDPRNLSKLHQNISRNGLGEKVSVFPVAVGQDSNDLKKRQFAISKFGGTSRFSTLDESDDYYELVNVKVVSLESILNNSEYWMFEQVVIKIDVEGFEPEVISSGMQVIQTLRPFMLVEFSTNPMRNQLANWDFQILTILFSLYSKIEIFTKKGKVECFSPQQLLEMSPFEVVNILFSP